MIAYLRRLLLESREQNRASGIAGELANCLGIGRSLNGFVHYSHADFDKARKLLSGTEGSVEAQRAASSHERLRGVSDLVAMTVLNDVALAEAAFIAMPWKIAATYDVEALLVCEKLEVLRQVRRFAWLSAFTRNRRTLVLFAGASGVFPEAAASELLNRSSAPVLYLADFDPKHLVRAAQLPRLEEVCLPPPELLLQCVRQALPNRHFRRHMEEAGVVLEHSTHSAIQRALGLLKAANGRLKIEDFPL